MKTATAPKLLDTEAAAELLTLKPGTLEIWRHKGKGPRYIKIGGKSVRYIEADLIAWLDAQIRSNTSQQHVTA